MYRSQAPRTIALGLFSLCLLSSCSQGKFTAGVGQKQIAPPGAAGSEDAIGTKDDDKIVPMPLPVPEATPILTPRETPIDPVVIVDPQPVPTPDIPKPTTDKDFNECGVYINTPIVADLFLTSEQRFYEVGQKPLAAQDYAHPVKTFCMRNLDIVLRSFTEGFPGYPDLKDWFILDIHFILNAPEAGDYKILLDSDDGSIVSINGQQEINVDGLRNGNFKIYEQKTVSLVKGPNPVRVQYMQGPGFDLALQLKWVEPGKTEPVFIPNEFLLPPVK